MAGKKAKALSPEQEAFEQEVRGKPEHLLGTPISALFEKGDTYAFDALTPWFEPAALESKKDSAVGKIAMDVRRKLAKPERDARWIDRLAAAARGDKTPAAFSRAVKSCRTEAMRALAAMADPPARAAFAAIALEAATDAAARQLLVERLLSKDFYTQANARDEVKALPPELVFDVLAPLFESQLKDKRFLELAGGLFGVATGRETPHKPDPRWIPVCTRLLTHKDLRLYAASVLAAIGSDEAIDTLLAAFDRVAPGERYTYAATLAATKHARVAPKLLAILEASGPDERGNYYGPLSQLGVKDAAEPLVTWAARAGLGAGERAYVDCVAEAIREGGKSTPNAERLFALLDQTTPPDRDWVLRALGFLKDPALADRLEAWGQERNLPDAELSFVSTVAGWLRAE